MEYLSVRRPRYGGSTVLASSDDSGGSSGGSGASSGARLAACPASLPGSSLVGGLSVRRPVGGLPWLLPLLVAAARCVYSTCSTTLDMVRRWRRPGGSRLSTTGSSAGGGGVGCSCCWPVAASECVPGDRHQRAAQPCEKVVLGAAACPRRPARHGDGASERIVAGSGGAGLCVSPSAPDDQGERVESVLPEDDADVLLLLLLLLFGWTAHWRVLVAADAAAVDALAPIAGTSMVIADASCESGRRASDARKRSSASVSGPAPSAEKRRLPGRCGTVVVARSQDGAAAAAGGNKTAATSQTKRAGHRPLGASDVANE
uniref:Uncharacterized protein n=1 Tax=Anopheles merus TaxID=30066 RepID=A0A182UYD4_ANOME